MIIISHLPAALRGPALPLEPVWPGPLLPLARTRDCPSAPKAPNGQTFSPEGPTRQPLMSRFSAFTSMTSPVLIFCTWATGTNCGAEEMIARKQLNYGKLVFIGWNWIKEIVILPGQFSACCQCDNSNLTKTENQWRSEYYKTSFTDNSHEDLFYLKCIWIRIRSDVKLNWIHAVRPVMIM